MGTWAVSATIGVDDYENRHHVVTVVGDYENRHHVANVVHGYENKHHVTWLERIGP